MASLSSHINVWETCLQLMERKGFAIRCWFDDGEISSAWEARKGDFVLMADNPIELLGLVAVHADVQPVESVSYWWAANTNKEVNVHDRMID